MFLKKCLFLAAVFIVFLWCATTAFAINGYPGSTWGELLWQTPAYGPQPNIPDLIGDGWIRQGADVASLDGADLVPYLTLRWTADTRALSWNNTVGPGIGISLLTAPIGNTSVTFGVENVWNYYYRDWSNPGNSRLTDTVNVYMDWYGSWDLGR